MATEQEISEALEALIHASTPNAPTFATLNDVVQQLQSKLGGHDLSHKADFIRSQIHYLLRSQPPPHHSPKDHFSLQQNPNYHPAPSSAFQTFPANSQPQLSSPEPEPEPSSTPVPASDPPKDGPKPKRKGGPGGLNKLCGVSPELQVIVGHPTLPRTEIVKQLWAYIRKHNLQDPGNKRKIICNDELRLVFETDCTDMFKMNKLLAKHIIALEPSKQPVPKKAKVAADSGTKSSLSGPPLIISEALAKFFGVGMREMLQTEVLQRIWEYIKVNRLEDPLNPMAILCDAKLQDLFGCESISALGIPEVLARNHIFRRS
ncbi:uncharacterized protein LOC126786600 [Argentina anserina]|uniref:uncharacterized protein LOC126786600 n=1 Tax=Argentina anserina TaxID=57926 RepID=UPI0021763702|nr:uncharacterized protein LOC126786600 [Potentilla anserina]